MRVGLGPRLRSVTRLKSKFHFLNASCNPNSLEPPREAMAIFLPSRSLTSRISLRATMRQLTWFITVAIIVRSAPAIPARATVEAPE
jgi:hypothetical protein